MFTGIVEELGDVVAVEHLPDAAKLTVRGAQVTTGASPGDSIAVNGVCLTVTAVTGQQFTADVMLETLRRSALAGLAPGSAVNLERPLPLGGRLGGHLVQGHVDGTGVILARTPGAAWEVIRIACPPALARYIVEKGSIAVDGTSLTVSALGDHDPGSGQPWFEVSLIPTTLEMTTLGRLQPGSQVNLEADMIAKHVERLLASQASASQASASQASASQASASESSPSESTERAETLS